MTSAAERLALLASTLEPDGTVPAVVISGPVEGVIVHAHVWNEVPAGVVDGANSVYTLADFPAPASSLLLFRNGLLMRAAGNDYTLANLTITFVQGNLPQPGDTLIASYTT